ncbi:MAG TPA: inositol monophosphatase family protein [Thermoanaerobaculia bacterium]|nr:inositol monophosphatase family protein [Thermoanaerobaculia bacterium]HUM28937.1 inositol monophosphatase family protein [Thermoanaerobaculia bacterium]HXK67130.1 inositol monophosphatase family protein [Thermoanaerobaculia bacterium]
MKEILAVARRAALAAGDLLRSRWECHEAPRGEAKAPYDLVSEADRASEEIIRSIIHRAFPDHAILGEEDGLQGSGDTQWIVDPLDGTANFLHRYPWWSVSIGVRAGDRELAAVVHNPLTGDLFTAIKGHGTMMNDRQVRVSTPSPLSMGFIATGFPFRHREKLDRYLSIFHSVFLQSRELRRTGSAALDLALVASGVFHGFFEFSLSPWDIAAGTLLVREAGGIVTDFEGGPDFMESGDIVAASPDIHQLLLRIINEI